MKKALLLLFTLSILFACKSQTKEVIESKDVAQSTVINDVLDAAAFKNGIALQDIQLIDVRTPKEYQEGHIENAALIDFFSKDFKAQFEKLDKNKPLYIYCRSGNRSGKASIILEGLGFTEIHDLKGGIKAWPKQ